MLIGSHLSIAGGPPNALLSAAEYGFKTVAMFVRNQQQWKSPPLSDETAGTFRRLKRELKIAPVVAHGSYLVNLAGQNDVRGKSIRAMSEDMDRCGRLEIEYLVIHPGSRPDQAEGITLIADALNRIIADCLHIGPIVLLETTAGQGNCIGYTFEQLAEILSRLDKPERFGVCLDTCHIFAAGYDIRTPAAYEKTMTQFDAAVGLNRLAAIHLNDSLGRLGSRLDRHAHIGLGKIGKEGFANLMRDKRLTDIPMILETPKGADESGRDWDKVNTAVLMSLCRKAGGQ